MCKFYYYILGMFRIIFVLAVQALKCLTGKNREPKFHDSFSDSRILVKRTELSHSRGQQREPRSGGSFNSYQHKSYQETLIPI